MDIMTRWIWCLPVFFGQVLCICTVIRGVERCKCHGWVRVVEVKFFFLRRLPGWQPIEGANAANEWQVDAIHGLDSDTQQVARGIFFGRDEYLNLFELAGMGLIRGVDQWYRQTCSQYDQDKHFILKNLRFEVLDAPFDKHPTVWKPCWNPHSGAQSVQACSQR